MTNSKDNESDWLDIPDFLRNQEKLASERSAQPPGDSHIANEWADMATNGVQWLRNIRDGISTPEEALAEMLPPSSEELVTFLTAWISVGSLQTFTSREKFRKEARYFIHRLGLAHEPAAAPAGLIEALAKMRGQMERSGFTNWATTVRLIEDTLRAAQPPGAEVRLRAALEDLVQQVRDFAAKYGEADFYIGSALAALCRPVGPQNEETLQELVQRYSGATKFASPE